MEFLRTFIAFETPAAIRDALRNIQSRLKEADTDVKWEAWDKFHVTVTFLGDVSLSTIEILLQRLGKIVAEHSVFDVVYRSIGCFPDKKHPRVLWIGCENTDGKLITLKAAIDKELRSSGIEIERRPFTPHVTLGRVTSERELPHLLSILENLTFEPRVATIGEITMMKSVLHPQGANYSILKSIQLLSQQ
jgi:2'-5' RNA ligase